MSAERGWIGDPQPEKEWHTPGWLSEKGTGHSHFHPERTPPSDAYKWYKMMGAAELLPETPRNEGSKAAGLDPLPEDEST